MTMHAIARGTFLAALALATAAGAQTPGKRPGTVMEDPAAGLRQFELRDACFGDNSAQPDTCLHNRHQEKVITFGGKPGTVYDVTLRVRGLFEPTRIEGGTAPDPAHPYFVAGGTDKTTDYSQWRIEVSEPQQSFTLNAYPTVSHTIHKEDFETTIAVAAGASIRVSVTDSNDRQIDNGFKGGKPDRQQVIEGVTEAPPSGQMLRLDVVKLSPRP